MFVETPCIVIDMDKVEHNLKRMDEICKTTGCHLRPHVKTHKIPELAKLQMQYGANGITVAKLSEAEIMASYGISSHRRKSNSASYHVVQEYSVYLFNGLL